MRRWWILVGLIMVLAVAAAAEPSLEGYLRSSLNIPVGRDSEVYAPGTGLVLSGQLPLSFFPALSLGLGLGYDLAPLQAWDASGQRSLSLLSSRLTLGLRWPLGPRWTLQALAEGGYYYGFLNGDGTGGSNPCVVGTAGVSYQLNPLLNLSTLVGYRNFLGLYNDISLAVGGGLDLGALWKRRPKPPLRRGNGVELLEVSLNPVFPVFFKYYDNHPVGQAVLVNWEKTPATDIKMSLLVKQYMDNPKQAAPIDRLEPGEKRTIELYGLFSSSVLEVTEGSKVSALLSLSYTQDKKVEQKEYIETLRIHNRNALSWDDDRKASAFVTAKDPVVQKFAKNVTGMIKGNAYPALDANLMLALALHEALDLYGITYVVDPSTPFQAYSQNETAIDYLQFPKQTLEFKAGDCDDLSILYAALLEAVGIETAFVTTPGHIYVAFALAGKPEDIAQSVYRTQDLIVREGRAWLPVEITERRRGFLKAWETGTRQWREAEANQKAGFYRMRQSWESFEPVGFPGEINLVLPDLQQFLRRYRQEIDRFVESEVAPKAARLELEIASRQGDVKLVNQLGVLYARYGLSDKAEAQFKRILSTKDYAPALINLGNLNFQREDWPRALSYYQRAQSLEPRNPNALLGTARALREMGKMQESGEAFARLKQAAPLLAQRFAYLEPSGGSRAAETEAGRGVVIWDE